MLRPVGHEMNRNSPGPPHILERMRVEKHEPGSRVYRQQFCLDLDFALGYWLDKILARAINFMVFIVYALLIFPQKASLCTSSSILSKKESTFKNIEKATKSAGTVLYLFL
ncbi:hypothetical protein Gasu2_58520 [Galdieria sulphuraria]|uniref:Uncharacterized protein n=1 Tax=Galdieria sulphuraria TaxID=130081 RepID=M2XWS0_GALSU|nr:uncharacterized protein Gasu_46830 [Galdieria sulphuraria]EME27864.1 hypothetical protein Gasu_46830 [Galdieria sulphuraria]GJD11724.1 hypothetical protein Gasu2_58520 [Galdieria sulphuraria]|eukprot:XP_005704384.1 hypothetical protein Gasu_46830 [Galdieria sulphuraria]